MGHTVAWIGGSSDYDLLLEGVARVEVKSALRTENSNNRGSGRYQFSLRRHGLEVDEELLVLLCYEDLGEDPVAAFVIPGEAVDPERTKIDITRADPTAYTGKWAAYLEAWEEVGRVMRTTPATQPTLCRPEPVEVIPF
jgi:hypothetical protein